MILASPLLNSSSSRSSEDGRSTQSFLWIKSMCRHVDLKPIMCSYFSLSFSRADQHDIKDGIYMDWIWTHPEVVALTTHHFLLCDLSLCSRTLLWHGHPFQNIPPISYWVTGISHHFWSWVGREEAFELFAIEPAVQIKTHFPGCGVGEKDLIHLVQWLSIWFRF